MFLPAILAAGPVDPRVDVRDCSGGAECVVSPDWLLNVSSSFFEFELRAEPNGTIVGWTLDSAGNPLQHFTAVSAGTVTSLQLVFTNLQDRVVGCPLTPGTPFPVCVVFISDSSNTMVLSGGSADLLMFDFGSTSLPEHFLDGTRVAASTNIPEPATAAMLALAGAVWAAARYRRPLNSCNKALNSGRLRSDDKSGSMRA